MFYIIPKPNVIKEIDSVFVLSKNTTIECAPQFATVQKLFFHMFEVPSMTEDTPSVIRFVYKKGMAREEYKLRVNRFEIVAEASTEAGALYAFQTLRQMFRLDTERGNRKAHCAEIEDKPHYDWRGLLFDEARHFFGKEQVKKMLDMFALHKLNVFHWHLTDDQGWRIQIDAYPKLTEVCAKRRASQINGWKRTDVDWTPHQGYYTKEDIKEIVAYAKDRNIMVVPEIDMPAHFTAILTAYPHLTCDPTKLPKDMEVPYYFGARLPMATGIGNIFDNIACAGKESTYEFIFKILDEVIPLFPAPYLHIGGDEAPKTRWKTCPDCQKRMQENGLKNEEELQGYFTNRIAEHVKKYGKSLIGWNEILKNKVLNKDTIAQYWTPQKDIRAENYGKEGGRLIISKHQAFYFDMGYAQRALKTTYEFTEEKYHIANHGTILGVEGAMWTEWIRDVEKLELCMFPRLEALAEVGWTKPELRNYQDFKNRLEVFKYILDKHKIGYAEYAVAEPKWYNRLSLQYKWYHKDPNIEVGLNRAAKAAKNSK